MKKILKNCIRCKLCGDVIESRSVHQYVSCHCGACAVDGGHDYLRRTFSTKDCFEDLSIVEDVPDETIDDEKLWKAGIPAKKMASDLGIAGSELKGWENTDIE